MGRLAPAMVRGGVFMLALWLGATPAVAGNADATAEYARQVSAAQLRAAQLEALLARQQERIEQLEEVIRLQGQTEANRLENIDQVNDEMARLRGQAEVLQFGQDDLKEQIEQLTLSFERRMLHAENRLRNIETNLRIKPPPPPTDEELGIRTDPNADPGTGDVAGAPDGSAPATAPAEMPPTAAGKLELAAEHIEGGRLGVARAILEMSINEHIGAEEMAETRYRLAETFSLEENWKSAIFEYEKVISNHRKSPWACWAYYRQGEAVEKLMGAEEAKTFYKGATNGACKGSDAAARAAAKL